MEVGIEDMEKVKEKTLVDVVKLRIQDADVGDVIQTKGVAGNPITFEVSRVEKETEGGSTKWGKVFYNKENHFLTELGIDEKGGIFPDSSPVKREGYAEREIWE